MGSLFEVETQLILIAELSLMKADLESLLAKIDSEQKMINSFISSLKTRSTNPKT